MKRLDDLGKKIAAQLKSLETQSAGMSRDLQIIWDAFDKARETKVSVTINGCKSKTEWAKWANPKAKYPMRAIQYALGGGNKKRGKASKSRVFTIKKDALVKIEGMEGVWKVGSVGEQGTPQQPLHYFTFSAEQVNVEQPEVPVNAVPTKSVDEQEEYMKRFKMAKKLARHYIELFKEYKALDFGGKTKYRHLLELYPNLANTNARPYGIQKIDLPATEREFLSAHDAALGEFNNLLKEGIALGWMTTEPRQSKAAVELEETLNNTETITLPEPEQKCDLTAEQVAEMFAEGVE